MIDTSKSENLSQAQLAEYSKAMAGRKAQYLKWAPKQEELPNLSDAAKFVAKQDARLPSGKRRISIALIGSVGMKEYHFFFPVCYSHLKTPDAGKSTTSGHLISELGFIDPRTLEIFERESRKIGKEASKFAWIMDKLSAERERSITITSSFWSVETNRYEAELIDLPGHSDFVKSNQLFFFFFTFFLSHTFIDMAVGASFADAALLIVSAAPGEFEQGIGPTGTTRNESLLAHVMGVKQFIVAINKMDMVEFKKERYDEVKDNIGRILKKIGVSEAGQIYIPISGYRGDNLIKQSENIPWWPGYEYKDDEGTTHIAKSLLECLDV